ncbi:MAG TPA: GNAT family N-acetyltransferase [Thermoanaerobaculia bacterium]|nr:GNAT family N-acetyltransferase [Thermoanaerobaculia bacterium]
MSARWTIRAAREGDAAALAELAERTFRDTFAVDNDPANMDLHCARHYSPAIQAAEIASPTAATLVVEHEGELIAYAQLGRQPRADENDAAPAVEIYRFYALSAWHGTGLAAALMDECVALAREAGAAAIRLGVWERNPRAIRFYEKHGFAVVGSQPFVLGNDPQLDLVMVRPLAPPSEAAAPIR